MCRYRYYFFGSCRHQQTVLFDFCENAQYIQHEQSSVAIASGTFNHGKNHSGLDFEQVQSSSGSDRWNDGNGETEEVEEGASVVESTNLDSLLSTTFTQSTHSTNSSFDRGSASIIAEPRVDCSSIPADHTSHPSPSAVSSHDMASSLLGGAFSRWISSGSAGKTSNAEVPSPAGELLQSRMHPAGIRQRTDESCNLTPMSDIIQHLAESCRDNNAQHIGTDGQRATSYGSIDTDRGHREPVQATQEAYDNLEAEIDQLKEDITRLRDEADRDRTTPKTEQELANDKFLATRSLGGQQTSRDPRHETAASRLQRQHEAGSNARDNTQRSNEGVQLPLSPLDFPALDVNKPCLHNVSQADSQLRKLSYADATTSGMLDANHHAFSAAMAKRADSKVSESSSDEPLSTSTRPSRTKTVSTVATQDSSSGREDEECSIIVSPRSIETVLSTNDPVVVSKGEPSAQNGKPARSMPHFAQPTQSYSRRTGESVRSPISPVLLKSSPGLPTKSMKAKEPWLATEKRATQRQQKRKSLPGDWIGSDVQALSVKESNAARKVEKTPVLTPKKIAPPQPESSPPSAEGWQKIPRRSVKEQLNSRQRQSKQSMGESPPRASMNVRAQPNKPSKSRIPVTTHSTRQKRESLPSPPVQLRPEPDDILEKISTPQRSNTMTSDSSSVQFILERGSAGQGSSPPEAITVQTVQHVKLSNAPQQSRHLTSPPSSSNVCKESSAKNIVSMLSQPTAGSGLSSQPANSQQIFVPSEHVSVSGYFPEGFNTTMKRRDSRGHLLTPIMKCLDAKGLLNKSTANNAMIETYLKSVPDKTFSDALKEARDSLPDAAPIMSMRRPHMSENSESSVLSAKVLAPHLRKQKIAGRLERPRAVAGSPPRTSPIQIAPDFMAAEAFGSLPIVDASKRPRVSSLRATAKEFTPIQSSSARSPSVGIEDAIRYHSGQEWNGLSPRQRRRIHEIRESFTRGGFSTAASMPPPLIANPQHPQFSDSPWLTQTNLRNGHTLSGSENTTTHTVQAGQVLRRTVSPGNKTVRWLLRDVDGKETPIKFGRAPPPANSPSYDPFTPTISSLSSSSPLKTPMAPNYQQATPLAAKWRLGNPAWHIRSTQSPVRYGWTGGDGKEIKFLGYGPYAERDPNSVVDFDFQGRTSSCHASVPNGFGEDKENSPAPVKVAPKSQRQWAEMLGYQKVPCGNVEITEAVEYCIPFGSQLAGYCHDCMANK